MTSSMLNMLQLQNPDRDYPLNIGQKWTDDEETTLLEELNKNINIEIIAQNHSRTIGGINARRKKIAYTMYTKNSSIEEIITVTRLDKEHIQRIIDRKLNDVPMKNKKPISLESQISEMRSEIIELKITIKELVEMMKAVYEFEDM